MTDKKTLSERDICTKFITPAITAAGWDLHTQIREEVSFTKGRIIVRGKLHTRGEQKRADYILYYKANIPIAVIEAKDNKHSVGAGTVVFYFLRQLTIDSERAYFLRLLIDNIIVRPDRLDITLSKSAISELAVQAQLQPGDSTSLPDVCHQPEIVEGADIVTLLLPIHFKRSCGRRWIVSRDGKDLVLPIKPKPDSVLVQAVGRGFAWKQMLEASPDITIKDLAKQCGYTDRYLSRHLALTGLAPDIVHQTLSGTLPSMVNLQALEEASSYLSWDQQRQYLGLN